MRINLRGGHVFVAEQFLNGAQVRVNTTTAGDHLAVVPIDLRAYGRLRLAPLGAMRLTEEVRKTAAEIAAGKLLAAAWRDSRLRCGTALHWRSPL